MCLCFLLFSFSISIQIHCKSVLREYENETKYTIICSHVLSNLYCLICSSLLSGSCAISLNFLASFLFCASRSMYFHSVSQSLCLSSCLSLYFSIPVFLSDFLSICIPVSLSRYVYIPRSLALTFKNYFTLSHKISIFLTLYYLSSFLIIYQSIYLPVYLSLHRSIDLSIFFPIVVSISVFLFDSFIKMS